MSTLIFVKVAAVAAAAGYKADVSSNSHGWSAMQQCNPLCKDIKCQCLKSRLRMKQMGPVFFPTQGGGAFQTIGAEV